MLKNKFSRVLKMSLSAVLILAILIVSFPFIANENTSKAVTTPSQTKLSLRDFQNERWTTIQNEVFGQNNTSVQSATTLRDYKVKKGNSYFNWTDTSKMQGYDEDGNKVDGGLIPYSGTPKEVASAGTLTENYSDYYIDGATNQKINITSSATYKVYNVYTADQFAWVMKNANNGVSKLNLCADIDMGGANGKEFTTGIPQLSCIFYMEGNGHTVYNLKMFSNSADLGLFNTIENGLIAKNFGFQSVMGLHQATVGGEHSASLFYGYSPSLRAAFINIHIRQAFFNQSSTSDGTGVGILGGKSFSQKLLVDNCSSTDSYVYGYGHVGGLLSANNRSSGSVAVRYDVEFPKNPMAFMLYPTAVMPYMVNNSYSANCELFSTGNDSGSFISCGRGVVAVNCFASNTMYSDKNTGGFMGRVIDIGGVNNIYDADGKKTIGAVFRNCYSSGVVEGTVAMGGFVGLDVNCRPSGNPEAAGSSSAGSFSTLYMNCYSTTMVGMDYTGKYCGGFIGLDDNYGVTNASVITPDGKKITNCNGAIYINCYAAGEVGNILTQSNTGNCVAKDTTFFKKGHYSSTTQMTDYYPTGGFIGAINLDAYYLATSNATLKARTYGTFYNCYYDMQTTGMHDMAIGLAYAETCRDSSDWNNYRTGQNESTKVVHHDAEGNEKPFSVIGITGLYTEKSDTKKVAGLTGSPVEYKNSNGATLSRMSMGGEKSVDTGDNENWIYQNDYYPQLKTFMASDTSMLDVSSATSSDITSAMKGSGFYTEEHDNITDSSGTITETASYPVLSQFISSDNIYENFTPNTNKYAAQIAGVITPYRYSQASTATVMLNHWDYKMNTDDGSLSTDTDWSCAVPNNKLTYNKDTGYFENTYKGLAAGKYEFKVQANNSMAYNYGSNRFDGQNCVLNIPVENCTAKILFKYNGLRTNNYQIYAVLTDSNGNPIDENGTPLSSEKKILLGGTDTQVVSEVWTLVGMLPNSTWNVTDSNYDLKMSPSDSSTYTYTCSFVPDKDENGNYKETECQFKIAKDHAWTESYGIAGKSDNMSFKYDRPCTVYFEFNNKTHITKATATEGSIYKVFTERATEYEFKGLSIIGQQSLTGYNWLESGKELDAAKAGQLTETSAGSGIYTVSFSNVKMGTNYAYKLIENAVDDGSNSYFSIKSHPTDVSGTCTVTFTYDESTKKVTVSAKIDGDKTEYANDTVDVNSLSVIGSENLTGYFWLGDKDHPTDQSDESKQNYKDGAIAAGLMEQVAGSDYLYRKTFYNKPAGTYTFKVGANGSLDMSWGESGSNDNYTFTLTKTADVTITFNRNKQMISVSTSPSDALDIKQYVVTGTENLMGKTWDLNDAVMTYNDEEGVYEYTKNNVKSGQNYAFKIVEQGIDSGSNISFSLASEQAEYNIKFTYDPKTGIVTKQAFTVEDNIDVTDRVIKPVNVTSYSVLGDKGLTGYNWLGLTDKGTPGTEQDEQDASLAGLMAPDENQDGTFTKTFTGVKVGTNGEIKSYPFKIAANGNWDSGISYGDENGDNYMLVLNGDGSGVTECDVTINFNPKTKKISVVTNPADCNMSDIDDSTFTWYVVGDYKLVSYDSFKASTDVYDTVRDITSKFTFTSGDSSDEKGIAWSINKAKNLASGFKDKIGENGFTLDYNIEGNDYKGTFDASVVDLTLNIKTDDTGQTISSYACNDFAPGKQWLSISTYGNGSSETYKDWQQKYKKYEDYETALKAFEKSAQIYYKVLNSVLPSNDTEGLVSYMQSLRDSSDAGERSYYKDLVEDYGDILALYEPIKTKVDDPGMKPAENASMIIGSRNLRLIPTVYLEAGNDADIAVYQGDDSKESSKNVVTYEKNASKDVTFTGINDTGFSNYNFAFTAGYAITDKVGLGIYDNYNNQGATSGNHGVKGYGKVSNRDQDNTSSRVTGTYFAMKSVFGQSDSYTDQAENKGLSVDTMIKQSLIGSSYDYSASTQEESGSATKKLYGQTIVKIYKMNDDGINSKVNVNANASKNSEEYKNFLKWTGQKRFSAEDKGEYNVTFYWTLSDGRYLSDTKVVKINILQPGISKSVDLHYDEAGNNKLVYNVTYTNSDFASPVTFGVLDILPFKGDTRIGYGVNNQGTTGSDVSFHLDSVKIKQSGIGTIKGVYYSQSKEVRSYLTDSDGKPDSEAAKKLDVNETGKIPDPNGYWNDITRAGGGGGTYVTNADNATAVAISGIQLGVAESITITITVEYTGKQNDSYVNNAFYMAYDTDKSADICNASKPVATNIVGRDLDGYVWLDSNLNGVIDSSEHRFKGATVALYKADDATGDYVDTGLSTLTDENGHYIFERLPSGNYKVVVDKKKNPNLNTESGDSYLFDKLDQTKKLLEARADDVVGSRNLSSVEKNSSGGITAFYVQTNMPTAVEIYRRSYTNSINARCDGYYYKKSYVNIGFGTDKCSMTIVKKGQDGKLLDGTAFKLEMYNEDTKEWIQVKFNDNGYIYSEDIDETTPISKFITGDKMPDGTKETGKIHLSNLPTGKYRISEVGASKDYAPVMVNFEVELPYKIKTADLESYKNDPIVNPSNVQKPDYTEGDYSCYRDVTFVVQNAKDINRFLPLTGSDSLLPIFILGAILILLGLALILYKSKKNKKKSDENKYQNGKQIPNS